MKKHVIMITGASGFTGRHACAYYKQQGMQVVAVNRRAMDPAARKPLGADEIRICDLTDRQRVFDLVQEVQPDQVLHLAGMNDVHRSWEDPLTCLQINVTGTLHLLDALASLSKKPSVLVVGSSLSFDPGAEPPRPTHPYSLSKTMQTLAARSWSHLFTLPVMAAEPTNLIGPGGSTGLCGLLGEHIARWERGLATEPFRFSSLTEKRDYLDVRDAVAAYDRILRSGTPGKLYRFGSGQLRSIGEVLHAFESVIGKTFPYLDLNAPPRDPDPLPSANEAIAQLGWSPRISFKQSITDIWRDVRERLAANPSASAQEEEA